MSHLVRVCQDWYRNEKYPERSGFWMDVRLKSQIDIAIKNVVHDWDFVIIITGGGEVRVGKSVLGLQICAYWTYQMEKVHGIKLPFNLKKNIVFQWQNLIETGNKVGKKYPYSAFQYDEAGETMEGSKSATSELKAVRDFLRECGQYNFLTILVMPEFFDLPKGIAITRSTFLIDVSYGATDEGLFQRGYYKFYSRKNKKKLYLYGKKELNYNAAPYNFDGEFKNFYPVDEKDYRETKKKALETREYKKMDTKQMILNSILYILNSLGYSMDRITKELIKLNRGIRMPDSVTLFRWMKESKGKNPEYKPFD